MHGRPGRRSGPQDRDNRASPGTTHFVKTKPSLCLCSASARRARTARKSQAGSASYYANRFHGRKTASGRPYHKDAMTAAHRTLPLGTWVRVTSVRNNRSVVVQITDRGPYYGGRIIDLSRAAATELDMLHAGTARVRLEVLQEPEKTGPAPDRSDLIIAYN
ncbi:MAG: septal ring lytic transglycosylase RlpA family protein [Comamonadaceae bacterium]|nr:septal ring lytic transglycosylase RlpA family protein [Comamonadaceae bacterium]